MSNPFEMFETDTNEEVDGVWNDFGDFRVKLARAGGSNTSWFKEMNKEAKSAGVATIDALDSEQVEDIVRNVFVKAVIKDHQVKDEKKKWEQGVFIKEDSKVQVVPFTVENTVQMLKQLPEYYKKLQKWADDYKTFLVKIEEKQEQD